MDFSELAARYEGLAVVQKGAADALFDRAPWEEGYPQAVRETVREELRRRAGTGGTLELVFHRIYLLARRPPAER